MKAVIYARQSSGNEDVSESVEAQIKNCLELAQRENFEVIGIFRDLNCSGELYPSGTEEIAQLDAAYQAWKQEQTTRKKYREGLGALFRKLPEVDFLLVNEMTRLYRPVNNSFLEDYIHNQLKMNHVSVLQVQGGKIDLSQFDQQLILALKNQILYDDLRKKRENSIKAFRNKRNSGKLCCGSRIFGITYLGKDRLSVNESKKKIIRLIYDRILSGTPLNSIIRECNRSAGELMMYPSLLYSIARQPVYAGYQYNTNGELIRNVQITGQEFITFEEWQKVQDLLSRRRRENPERKEHHWLPLSGRIYCGVCGRKLVCRIDHGKIYYTCNNRKFNPLAENCSKSRIRFESGAYGKQALYDAILPLLTIGILKAWKEHLSVAGQETQRTQNKTHEILELFVDGAISKRELCQLLNKNRTDNTGITGQTPDKKSMDPAEILFRKQLYRIAGKKIDRTLYEKLVEQSGIKVTVYENEIQVSTAEGVVRLPRSKERKYGWLPDWKIRFSWKKKRDTARIPSLKITYYSSENNLLGAFSNIKIVTKYEKK